MHINFQKVIIHNFMSFGHAELCFEDDGFIKVTGINENPDDMATSNGSGKSSLWESIIWALTGDTIRGTKHVSNLYGDDGTYVQLMFNIDSHDYNIIRAKDHKQYKTSLLIEIDGKDCSGKGIRESDKLLTQYLPDLNSSLLGSVIILGQGLPQRFTNNTPSGRKEVLETLSKSDFMIEDLRVRIDNRKQELTTISKSLADESIRISTKVEVLTQTLSTNETQLSTLSKDALNTELSQLESCLNDIQLQLNAEEALVVEFEEKIETHTAALLDTNSAMSADMGVIEEEYLNATNSARERLNEVVVQSRSLEAEIKRLESIKDVCPTCGQKLPNVIKHDTAPLREQLSAYKQESDKLNSDLLEATNRRRVSCNEINTKYMSIKNFHTNGMEEAKKGKKDHNLKCIEYNSKINDINNRVAYIRAELSRIDSTIANLIGENDRIRNEIASLNEQMLYNNTQRIAQQSHLDVLSKFDTAIKRDFRGFLLHSVIEYIENRAKMYSKQIFETDKISFCLDGNNINISYMGKEYENLSGGEKQKIDLIIQFSIRDMLCNHIGFTSNILVLDEVFDGLDMIGCHRVIDLITNLSDIKNVFIVTHRKDLSIPCDKELLVVKSSDGISEIR
jgi:DNA repair exonuclease SbcCD ATPase subunit